MSLNSNLRAPRSVERGDATSVPQGRCGALAVLTRSLVTGRFVTSVTERFVFRVAAAAEPGFRNPCDRLSTRGTDFECTFDVQRSVVRRRNLERSVAYCQRL